MPSSTSRIPFDHKRTSALLKASKYGHLPIVAALLAAGAEVDLADKYGGTPLHKAAYYGRVSHIQ